MTWYLVYNISEWLIRFEQLRRPFVCHQLRTEHEPVALRGNAHARTVRDLRLPGRVCPATLAEEWDNVGLLAGDPAAEVARVMTCLTITPDSAREAVERRADLIVSHHPLPFRPVAATGHRHDGGAAAVAADHTSASPFTVRTRLLIPPRTASTSVWRKGWGCWRSSPWCPWPVRRKEPAAGGMGRVPQPATLRDMAARLKQFLSLEHLHYVGSPRCPHRTGGRRVWCGGRVPPQGRDAGCHLLVLGETNLHTCLEAEATGIALLLPGHFASERFAVDRLADTLWPQFPTRRGLVERRGTRSDRLAVSVSGTPDRRRRMAFDHGHFVALTVVLNGVHEGAHQQQAATAGFLQVLRDRWDRAGSSGSNPGPWSRTMNVASSRVNLACTSITRSQKGMAAQSLCDQFADTSRCPRCGRPS